MAPVPPITGMCDRRFEGVRDALGDNFREHGELGAAVAITLEGTPVVDMWAGWMDDARTRAWEDDTLVAVFSVGKAMAALCVLMLADRGQVDLDAPVSRYWPEFAGAGKEGVTVRMLLSHRAGLPGVRRVLPELGMYDWDLMAAALAAEKPWWQPGSTHGYHVNTFGFLTGEIVRRVSGLEHRRLPGEGGRGAARRRPPLRLRPRARRADGRVPVRRRRGGVRGRHGAGRPRVPTGDARTGPAARPRVPEPARPLGARHRQHARVACGRDTFGERPCDRPRLARLYTALACGGALDGVRLLRSETLDRAVAEASAGPDLVLGRPSRFGLGFQLTQPERPLGPNPRTFGHFGVGRLAGVRRPGRGPGVRLHDEPLGPALAEPAQPCADRSGLQQPVVTTWMI